jgi:predicted transcriptional regulator
MSETVKEVLAIPTLVELGKSIRKKRRDLEMRQGDLAIGAGCSRATIVRLEEGTHYTDLRVLIEVCRELNIKSIKIVD